MSRKTVRIEAHAFDCCPGHVVIVGKGSASHLSFAIYNAVRQLFRDPRIFRKQIHSFKLDVVVVPETVTEPKS